MVLFLSAWFAKHIIFVVVLLWSCITGTGCQLDGMVDSHPISFRGGRYPVFRVFAAGNDGIHQEIPRRKWINSYHPLVIQHSLMDPPWLVPWFSKPSKPPYLILFPSHDVPLILPVILSTRKKTVLCPRSWASKATVPGQVLSPWQGSWQIDR